VSDTISVYWQTGCTSCLRTKEYLEQNGVAFRSCNVLEDEAALDELARFGLRQVPIVVRGDRWANGQILRDVAKLCGLPFGGETILPPEELQRRVVMIIEITRANTAVMPATEMATNLPDRPRSHADLIYHIFNIVDAFIEHEEGIPLVYESYYRVPPHEMQNPESLVAYGDRVRQRFNDWVDLNGESTDWSRKADVYYGDQSLHDFLERTTWHSGQHARQLIWMLERLNVAPSRTFLPDAFRGLPMPEKIWDAEQTA
jgi:glutaredoxin